METHLICYVNYQVLITFFTVTILKKKMKLEEHNYKCHDRSPLALPQKFFLVIIDRSTFDKMGQDDLIDRSQNG